MFTLTRRSLIAAAAAVPAVTLISKVSWADEQSPLIYITPIKTNGEESACQAEVWYLGDGDNMYVVTDATTWRAKAVGQGLASARIWVGDVGVWKSANGKYKDLPQVDASASFETDAAEHVRVLELFGLKYSAEWGKWGPRFSNGLADGSRVMLKYSAAA
jgi:hypothetical protein